MANAGCSSIDLVFGVTAGNFVTKGGRPTWNWSARFVKYVAKVLSKWMASLIDGRLFVN